LREKMQFLADAIEIDIDERGKMVMLWGFLIGLLMV
jgi:hypothetical protein